ncbi:GNAT family N-acetyltransferase [Streptomyces jumonjinensis]|uniref:GNAT family N-acetyltransferase n=1 Tax=Streptomyces jumonjinensis TaxID=1945 RepID=UPI0037B138DC
MNDRHAGQPDPACPSGHAPQGARPRFGSYRGETDAQAPGEVYALYVDPARTGRGIGRDLLDSAHHHAAAQRFSTMQLWVLRDNTRAREFYAAAGYVADGAVEVDMYGETAVSELRYRRPLMSR